MKLNTGIEIIDAIAELDVEYACYLMEEWYLDNIEWRFRHYIMRERCETCRNWHFSGFEGREQRMYGACDLHTMNWQDFHGYCPAWNLDVIGWDTHCREDGFRRVKKTPNGKIITQISKGGIWQYLHDGDLRNGDLGLDWS
jgi:hypothetical protein